jgi:hypothetical protein
MLADHAFSNAHPKPYIAEQGLKGGWNNNPSVMAEITTDAMAQGGIKVVDTGRLAESAKILLEESVKASYLLAGNSPESQGEAPSTIRSGVGIARVISASDVGLYLTQDNLNETEERFYRIVRDLCGMMDEPATMPLRNGMGEQQNFQYDRTMMGPHVDVVISTDRDIDQEREEIFSRALDLKMVGDPAIDFELLEDLSGIPPDILRRAKDRLAQAQMKAAMEMSAQGGMASPGSAGPVPSSAGNGASPFGAAAGGLPAPLRQRRMGARAPTQARPPSRSRGSQVPTSPLGGGGGIT